MLCHMRQDWPTRSGRFLRADEPFMQEDQVTLWIRRHTGDSEDEQTDEHSTANRAVNDCQY
jgi:hypothetical protein